MDFCIFDRIPEAVLILDFEGKINYYNGATIKLPKRFAAQGKIAALELGALFSDVLGEEISLNSPFPTTTLHTFKDQNELQVRLQVTLQPFTKTKSARWIVFIHDFTREDRFQLQYETEVQKKEAALKDLQEAKDHLIQSGKSEIVGQFMSSITHELNNPLTYLLSSAEQLTMILEEEPIPMNRAKKMVENVNKGVNRILQLSNHLKTFLHSPLGKENLVLSGLQSVVDRAISFTQHYSVKHKIKVRNLIPETLPQTLIDPTLIEQIAINLIRNSVDAITEETPQSETERYVEIEGKFNERSNSITLSFVDHGPGIQPEVMNKLFTRFFTTKPIGKGTGLGLNICAAIAEKHGGTLTAKSAPGEGATFLLTLPVVTVQASPIKKAEESIEGLKVLLVDDEPRIREIQKNILTQLGCTIYEAKNGVEALAKCKELSPDITITDLAMQEMSGIEFARIAKNLYRDMQIILLTGSNAFNTLGKNQTLFDDFVEKPFPSNSIRNAILNVIDKRRTSKLSS